MSPKHVMTSLVLFVTIATLHVSGEPSEGAKQSPICRQMCANVSALCQRDCHYSIGAQSNGTNHWEGSESNFIDQSKYRCINKCMDEDQAVMLGIERGFMPTPSLPTFLNKLFGMKQRESAVSHSKAKRSVRSELAMPSSGSQTTEDGFGNICPTVFNTESPAHAVHDATGLIIDLHRSVNVTQLFQIATCVRNSPAAVTMSNSVTRCAVTYVSVKAWVVFNPKTFLKPELVNNCLIPLFGCRQAWSDASCLSYKGQCDIIRRIYVYAPPFCRELPM